MFIGHYAAGLGCKRLAPTVSLGALFLACQWADLLWPTLVLAGIERFSIHPGATVVTPLDFEYYPFSHSLLGLFIWGIVIGLVYRAVAGSTWRAAAVLAALVLSHWVLDVIVHRPDMPLAPDLSPRLGLGLWDSIPATFAVEFALYAAGVLLYLKATVVRDRIGSIGLWILLLFLAVVEVANILGPPPPSVTKVGRNDAPISGDLKMTRFPVSVLCSICSALCRMAFKANWMPEPARFGRRCERRDLSRSLAICS